MKSLDVHGHKLHPLLRFLISASSILIHVPVAHFRYIVKCMHIIVVTNEC